jgi:hypothetical protein
MIITGLVSVLSKPATAQQNDDANLAPIKGPEELWYLLSALDALIFCTTVEVLKEPTAVLQARIEVQPYFAQLGDSKGVEAFNEAIKSSDGKARVEQNKTAISDAAKEIEVLLSGLVSPSISDRFIKAFSRSSTLLIARASENQSWWCRVYAFRKVRC